MNTHVAYEDAIDLLDSDHQSVKRMFIDYGALCEDGATADAKHALALRICHALTAHAQLEEEIFYPAVRGVLDNEAVIDEALDEHDAAKVLIGRIEAMQPKGDGHDDAVKQLGTVIDLHVLHEREQIFLKARLSGLDLRGLTLPLFRRQMQLKKKAGAGPTRAAA